METLFPFPTLFRSDEGLAAATGTQVAGQLASGRPLAAAWTILTDAGRGRIGRFGEQLKQELGQMLTDTNVSSVEEAMRLVEQRAAPAEAFAARLAHPASTVSKARVTKQVGTSGHKHGRE